MTTTLNSNVESVSSPHSPCSDIPPSEHQFPQFPKEAYLGVGAEFAELYARNYESPKEFFYFDFLILAATSLSGLVRADFGDLKTHTRLYGLKIGPSGTSKKSTSYQIAEDFVRKAWSKAVRTEETRTDEDLWGDQIDHSTVVFKTISGVGSAEGLLEPLNGSRVLVYFDEFDRFMKKAGTEGSVLGTAFNELFERTDYANYTKSNRTLVQNGHLGLIANIPLDQFENMTSSGKLADLGLWNRFTYVIGDRQHECDRLTNVPAQQLNGLINQLANYCSPFFEDFEQKTEKGQIKQRRPKKEQKLQMTSEAWNQWVTLKTVLGHGETVTRLDTIGMRLLAVLAVTSGKTEIDLDVVNAVLAFLAYQKQVRETYRPSQAETQEAKIEEAILRQLKRRGPLKKRDLQRHTSASRYGIERFNAALKALKDDQQIIENTTTKQYSLKEPERVQ